jgi:hypothetical protein
MLPCDFQLYWPTNSFISLKKNRLNDFLRNVSNSEFFRAFKLQTFYGLLSLNGKMADNVLLLKIILKRILVVTE